MTSCLATEKLDRNSEQSIIGSLVQNTNQSFVLPFFDGNRLLSRPSSVTKVNSFSLTLCNNRQIDHKIHRGFTANEEILIKNALQVIADRLFKAEILENMYRICGTSGHLLETGVWSRSQLENNNHYHGAHDLLRFQLMCLEKIKFPTIDISPMYAKSDTQSQGTIGCVSCISHGSTFLVKGKFEVKLNRYNLDPSNENVGNTIYWAGAIVHEMLHNLGHIHRDNDYTNNCQINIFENSFIYNGNYSP